MSDSKLTPIDLKNRLAGNPSGSLKFSVSESLKGGESLHLADPKATRAMVALMDMQAVLGGAASHWGGPSAFAELLSALYAYVLHDSSATDWFEKYHLINDAGHCENGLYALKANYGMAGLSVESLKGFRSIESVLTGHGESHLFPEGVYLSNGPLGSSLPQAQGLCLADQLAGRERVTVTAISDGACMEGEAKEALSAIPGFAAKGEMAPFVLLISDNNTKLSGRIDTDAFSMTPSFMSLKEQGWEVLSLKNGHDLGACLITIEEAMTLAKSNPKKPVVIHANTIKGYAVKATATSSSGGHGFPLKKADEIKAFVQEIYGDQEVPKEFLSWCEDLVSLQQKRDAAPKSSSEVKREKVQVGVSAAMIEKREQGLPVVSVTSDLPGSTGVAGFRKAFPDSSVDVGVAEANMVSVAAGLSKEGFIPVVDTFSQFGVTKGALPLIMAALSEAPVIAIFSHAGFQDAADGASHQALSYFAMTAAIPNTDVHCLTASTEAKSLVGEAIEKFAAARRAGQTPRSQIFFLGRENFPQNYLEEGFTYQLGQAQVGFDNSSEFENAVTLVGAGPLFEQALQAAEALAAKKIGAVVVNPSCINRPDTKTLGECLKKTKGRIVTVEDHQVIGGMGALVTHALSQAGHEIRLKSLGVNDEFGQSAYKAAELYAKHAVDQAAIEKAAASLI